MRRSFYSAFGRVVASWSGVRHSHDRTQAPIVSPSGMSHPEESTSRRKVLLALGALGVVYGDIGTSPLYALREAMSGPGGHGMVAPNPANVVGILSLIIWALLSLIAVKYISVVMRAGNDGEGGLLAMLALAAPHTATTGTPVGRRNYVLVLLALPGTSFVFGGAP
jgi:KUP system potassium uptake protein